MNIRTNINRIPIWRSAVVAACFATCALSAQAQTPNINTFFPIGGQVGKTVEVEIRGSGLDGATKLLVHGAGITGDVGLSGGKADDAGKQVWQNKCGTCHELRSPANRSLTTAQWQATVERMIKVRQAPITPADSDKINAYLLGQARNGRLTAQVKIAPDAMPGLYELRVVTQRGVSTAGLFEVGNLPEVIAVNNSRQTAQPITFPCVANGCIANNGERHYFRFAAKKGERIVFNFKGFRYKEESVLFFNPNLRLYDSTGKEIVENHGYYDFDPLIDWTCPADGPYTIEVRDLLGRGNPGSVYRLTMGSVPYDTVLYPAAGQAGVSQALHVVGKNTEAVQTAFTLPMPTEAGLTQIGSPWGSHPFFVSRFPVTVASATPAAPVKLPGAFSGHITKAGDAAAFPVTGEGRYEIELYSGRIGSPGNMAVTLVGPDGRGINRAGNDGRMEVNLEAGKAYTLKVEEAAGQAGPGYTFAVEARPAHPRLEVVARPSNINLRPGLSALVEVIPTKREGIAGEITVRAENLPPGVTASPAVISPDRGSAYLVLTASPGAKPVSAPIRITASGNGQLGQETVRALPQEHYRLQNDDRYRDRAETVVAVEGDPEFIATFASKDPIKLHPRKLTEVKVQIKRSAAFKGNVSARIDGLPRGWVCYQETVGGDKEEMTLIIRPNGDDTRPFLTRDPKFSPIHAVLVAGSDQLNPGYYVFAMGTALCVKSDAPDDGKDQ